MKQGTIEPSKHGPVGIVMPLATQRGGCETMLRNLLRANRTTLDRDYRICFLEDGPMVSQSRELGYDTRVIVAGRLRQPLRFARCVWALARWVRRNRLRQVVSFMEKAHLYASPAAVLARVPAAWWLHSTDAQSKLMRLIAALPANHVFSDSQAALDLQNPAWRRHPSTVCHCAVDLNRFASERLPTAGQAKAQLGLPGGPVVGVVARLQRWKGVDVFIRAAARILADEHVRKPAFVVVGGEHDLEPGVREELEALIDQLSVRQHVRLVGYHEDVPLWMQAMDVVIHCSTGVEPFGTVIVEAMALGKPVIAADAGGPREIITDGVDGRLTPPGDFGALADAVEQLLSDPQRARTIGEAARRRAMNFSADRLAIEVGEAFDRLAAMQ